MLYLKFLAITCTVVSFSYLFTVHTSITVHHTKGITDKGMRAYWFRESDKSLSDYTYTEFKRLVALMWLVFCASASLTLLLTIMY